jgi:hypothetical protein
VTPDASSRDDRAESTRLPHPLLAAWIWALLLSCAPHEVQDQSSVDAGRPPDMDVDRSGYSDTSHRRRSGVGDNCAGPLDCVSDSLCVGTRQPERFLCMAQCDVANSICSDGSVCVSVARDQTAICYIGGDLIANEPCDSNLECEPGALCFGSSAEEGLPALCRSACSELDDVCSEGEYCLSAGTSGLCRSRLGARCTRSEDCTDHNLSCSVDISADLDGYFPGGACTKECSSDAECAALGGVCRNLFATNRSVCLQHCDHNGDCRFYEDYGCYDRSICEDRADSEACRNTFGTNRLCTHAHAP